MLLRFMQASPALAGITAALLAATAGAESASPAAPGQPGPVSGWPGSAASSRLILPRPGEVVLTGSAVDGSRPRVIVPAAHAGSAGGMVQTAFKCDDTSAAGPARRFLAADPRRKATLLTSGPEGLVAGFFLGTVGPDGAPARGRGRWSPYKAAFG
jgi:hypothetical protein